MQREARPLGGLRSQEDPLMVDDTGASNRLVSSSQESWGAAMDEAEAWAGQLAARAKDQPLTALLMAIGVGYVLRMLTHSRI